MFRNAFCIYRVIAYHFSQFTFNKPPPHSYESVFETDCHVKIAKFTVFSTGSFCQVFRVIDEAFIAETAV